MIDHMRRTAVVAALAAAAVAQTGQGSQFHPQPRAAQTSPQPSPQTGSPQGDVRPTQITMQDDHGKSGASKPLLARELFRLIDRNGDGRIDDGEAAQFRAAVEHVVQQSHERQLQRTQDQKDLHGDLRDIHDDRQDLRDDRRDVRDDLRDSDLRDFRDDRQDLRDDRQNLQQDLRQRAADRPQGMPAPQGEVRLQTVRAPAAPRTAPAPIRR